MKKIQDIVVKNYCIESKYMFPRLNLRVHCVSFVYKAQVFLAACLYIHALHLLTLIQKLYILNQESQTFRNRVACVSKLQIMWMLIAYSEFKCTKIKTLNDF